MISRASSERLIKHGFVSEAYAGVYAKKSIKEINIILKKKDDAILAKEAAHEVIEHTQFQYLKTPFPQPNVMHRIWWENFNLSIEESYFWVLDYLRTRVGFPYVVKTEDVFAAAENSAFFGVSQQRIGLQQDKVSQYLATIGKMVKELFQLVRELRIIDERLMYYRDSLLEDRKKAQPAEITLKGIYIDMVEQGAKNPASVYGMARELQFVTLPDLFFSITPKTKDDVAEVVDLLEFNEAVKRVLKRKLYSFLAWKDKTYDEIRTRRAFTLKYLKQHWEIIRMYMNWVRPYLRHIKRLTLDEEKTSTPDLIAAFEGSMIEIELLAYQLPWVHDIYKFGTYGKSEMGRKNKKYHSVMICHFLFRTRPAMSYQQEGYNRGPLHVGRMELELRSYVWTKEQIDNYIAMKTSEDLELMEVIGGSVRAAMESLGDELLNYLDEAEKKAPENIEKNIVEGKKSSIIDTALAPAKGIKELFTSMLPKGADSNFNVRDDKQEMEIAAQRVSWCIWETYKNFKKEHKMFWW